MMRVLSFVTCRLGHHAGGETPLRDPNGRVRSRPHPAEVVLDPNIFRAVWAEASSMRTKGELLQLGARIECPVVALHGDHDPHPAEGVQEPLRLVLRDFKLLVLKNCGHRPWAERQARNDFCRALEAELAPD